MADENKIGNLNGKWSIMLRISLTCFPVACVFTSWLVVQQFQDIAFRESGERFSQQDGRDLEDRLRVMMDVKQDAITSELRDLKAEMKATRETLVEVKTLVSNK